VSVTSGYTSAEAAAYEFLAQFIGTTDASITRKGGTGGIDGSLLDELRRDPDVDHVDGQLDIGTPLIDAQGRPVESLPAQVRGVRRPDDRRVERLKMREGQWFDGATGNVAVIDQVAKEKLRVKLGDTFALPGLDAKLELKVVGVIHKPGIFAGYVQSVYVPLETLQNFALPENPEQVSTVFIELKPGVDDRAFAARWTPRLAQRDPTLKLRIASETRKEMDRNLQGVHVLSYLGGTVSMLAATFIVFSALAMGVSERQRTLAMMRAVGAFRAQLAALVMLEGAMLALAGAIVGVPLGVAFVHILAIRFENVLTAGAIVSWGGIVFATVGSVLAALAASALPAWNATRVDPLEAMAPLAQPPASGLPWKPTVVGLVLILIDPLLAFGGVHSLTRELGFDRPDDLAKPIAFFGHFVIGLPALMVGFFLLAPLTVWLVERGVGPVVAAVFGLRFSMLRQQLSGGIWRAAGTCAALMVGLAILVVMNTQGRSAIDTWNLPDKFPDVFITGYRPGGFKSDDQRKIAQVPGIRQVMPILYSPTQLVKAFFSFKGAEVLPDATLFIGVDPDLAFEMMELTYLDDQGRQVTGPERDRLAAQARDMLKRGRHVVVTNEFRELRGLKTGDTITLNTPKHGQIEYTIAGVVWSPGIDVFVSFFDLGQQIEERTAASVFGSLADARDDFGLEGAYLFAANLEPGLEKEELIKRIGSTLAGIGFAAYDVRQIKYEIQLGFRRMLLLVSTIAFAAMAVASLGVTNTIMASVRTRRWQFGVLRSVGFTRDGLMRLVLAEAVLIGIVGCVLGLAAGFEMAVNAKEIWGMVIGFRPPTQVPWEMVIIGVTVVMTISVIASIVPALTVARAEPLELLQAGRAAG
jgi:putative ABC transport system permease protein